MKAFDPFEEWKTWSVLDNEDGTLSEKVHSYLVSEGYSGSVDDMMFKYLRDELRKGSLSDMLFASGPLAEGDDDGGEDPPPDNPPVSDDGFSVGPVKDNNGGAVRIRGKSKGWAKFILPIDIEADKTYEVGYDADWSELSLEGKKAFVGFGGKTAGGDWYALGLKGDGSTGVNKYEISGSEFGKPADPDRDDGGAATNGTQSGPNYIRLTTSADGTTLTFSTSSDSGSTWDEELVDQSITDISNITDFDEAGIFVFLEDDDRGSFTINFYDYATGDAVADGDFANVVLLLGFDGEDGATATTDDSNSAHEIRLAEGSSNAQLDTAQFKFGTASLLLDDSGGTRGEANDSADWDFGAGQFTVEAWIRFNAVSGQHVIVAHSRFNEGNRAWLFEYNHSSAVLRFAYSTDGDSFTSVSDTWNPSLDTWYHVAADRDGSNVLRVYADGVMIASAAAAATINNSGWEFNIGAATDNLGVSVNRFDGWIDELRITKGTARYASDSGYDVPTEAFPRS